MGQVIRLQRLARNVVMTVPVSIRRELNLAHRHYVIIERGPGRSFTVRALEGDRDDGATRSAHPARPDH